MKTIHYLTVKEVIALNACIIKRYSPDEQIGILNQSLLESAVFRPQQSAFGEDAYPTFADKASALFESLGQNHAFINANKRTAFGALATFFLKNGYTFIMDAKQAEDLTVAMVNHEYSFKDLSNIISQADGGIKNHK
jgi:death-on-curing protein